MGKTSSFNSQMKHACVPPAPFPIRGLFGRMRAVQPSHGARRPRLGRLAEAPRVIIPSLSPPCSPPSYLHNFPRITHFPFLWPLFFQYSYLFPDGLSENVGKTRQHCLFFNHTAQHTSVWKRLRQS